jgi:hypothetical protein
VTVAGPRVDRVCAVCGSSLSGHRKDARSCSPVCRAEASRLRRLLRGESVDGYEIPRAEDLGGTEAHRGVLVAKIWQVKYLHPPDMVVGRVLSPMPSN